jgi:ribonuclease T2
MNSLIACALAALAQANIPLVSPSANQCERCTNPQLSCNASPTPNNTCCYESPGGLLQQVQFWDTDPATGPTDSWTIHGLWPNNCDGTYQEKCDPSRAYTNITEILEAAGATATLDFMQTYWLSDDESNEAFWDHEW